MAKRMVLHIVAVYFLYIVKSPHIRLLALLFRMSTLWGLFQNTKLVTVKFNVVSKFWDVFEKVEVLLSLSF